MKKMFSKAVVATLVAGLFAVSSVQAATVYKKDGFTYKIKGDLQIQLRQDPGVDQDMDVEYDDLEIKNSVSYDLDDNMTAFGQLDFGFKDAADDDGQDNPELEEAYIGFGFDKFSVLVGKTDSAADEFGIQGAYEHPLDEDAFDYTGYTDGDDLIKAEADFGAVTVVVAHEIEAESEKSDGNGEFTDIFVGTEFSGIELGLAYQTAEVSDVEFDTYGVSIGYSADMFSVAADYSEVDSDDDADDMTEWNLFASVKVADTTTLGAGYAVQDFDLSDEEIKGWYANVTYKFPSQKNVKVFAEIADTDEDDSDMGYLVGAQIKF
ncbi:Outer membrane protein (porin) [Malonomonas rubra DSM 5091]|uniref:Outer membrane protein (Porin) n=1 Tax=Malonomonas rubra DSM 5091 TaxID=1122189 RepID=A0A1M6HLY1_MALRU|nr:porin [Malonomonas rubra]SHJ23150.1 Outer membrane protein (porin) [Malonomonas rubra DSM 5091]